MSPLMLGSIYIWRSTWTVDRWVVKFSMWCSSTSSWQPTSGDSVKGSTCTPSWWWLSSPSPRWWCSYTSSAGECLHSLSASTPHSGSPLRKTLTSKCIVHMLVFTHFIKSNFSEYQFYIACPVSLYNLTHGN